MVVLKSLFVGTLFWTGHVVSLVIDVMPDNWFGETVGDWLYPAYQWCMIQSCFYQDLWELDGPWDKRRLNVASVLPDDTSSELPVG